MYVLTIANVMLLKNISI